MSPSTATAQPTTATPNTWEKLWRGSGINAVALFLAGYFVYGTQPGIGAPVVASRVVWKKEMAHSSG